MPTKTTVAEFRDFYNDPAVWANEAWYDGLAITIDGKDVDDVFDWANLPPEILPSSAMTISGGAIFRKSNDCEREIDTDLEKEFKLWRKARASTTVSITVPNEKLDALKAFVKDLGGKLE
jgi:hypothetical protein